MADSIKNTTDSHRSPKQLHTSAPGTNTTPDINAAQEVQANANLSATDIGNATVTNGQPTISTVIDLTNNAEPEATITKNEKFVVHLCTKNMHGALHPINMLLFKEAVSKIHLLCNSLLGQVTVKWEVADNDHGIKHGDTYTIAANVKYLSYGTAKYICSQLRDILVSYPDKKKGQHVVEIKRRLDDLSKLSEFDIFEKSLLVQDAKKTVAEETSGLRQQNEQLYDEMLYRMLEVRVAGRVHREYSEEEFAKMNEFFGKEGS